MWISGLGHTEISAGLVTATCCSPPLFLCRLFALSRKLSNFFFSEQLPNYPLRLRLVRVSRNVFQVYQLLKEKLDVHCSVLLLPDVPTHKLNENLFPPGTDSPQNSRFTAKGLNISLHNSGTTIHNRILLVAAFGVGAWGLEEQYSCCLSENLPDDVFIFKWWMTKTEILQ